MQTSTPTPSVSPSADTPTETPTPSATPAEPQPTMTVTLQPVSNDSTVDAVNHQTDVLTMLGVLLLFVAGVAVVKHLW